MSCKLCWMKMSSVETQEMWGVGTAIHLGQWCLPSQPLTSAWDTVLNTDPVHFQSCTLCFSEGTRKVERAALLLAPIRNASHRPLEICLRVRLAQISLRTKRRQRGKGRICLLALDLVRTGSKSCPFSPPLPPHYPFPRLHLPSCTDPNFSPIPAIHVII